MKRKKEEVNKKPKKIVKKNNETHKMTQGAATFLDESILFQTFKQFISPLTNSINPSCCDSKKCFARLELVESILIRNKFVGNPYPLVYGCFKHGKNINFSLNNERSKLYIEKFKEEFAKQKITNIMMLKEKQQTMDQFIIVKEKSMDDAEIEKMEDMISELSKEIKELKSKIGEVREECKCEMIWIPKYFSDKGLMMWSPKPFSFCQSHNAVHYCIQSTFNCMNCFCCLSGTPCPFRCYYVKNSFREGNQTCGISGITFPMNSSDMIDIELLNRDQYRRNTGYELSGTFKEKNIDYDIKIARSTEQLLENWLTLAKKKPYCQRLTLQYIFNFYMIEFKDKGTDLGLHPCTKYDYPGVIDFYNILSTFNEKNFLSIYFVPDFASELLRLWKILVFYFPFFLSWKFCFVLVSYLQSLKGFLLKDVCLIPLHESYYRLMTHMVNVKPPNVIKSSNMAKCENEFSTNIDNMSVVNQKNLLNSIVSQKILLFDLREIK